MFFAWISLVLFYVALTAIHRPTTSTLTSSTDTGRKMPTFQHKVMSYSCHFICSQSYDITLIAHVGRSVLLHYWMETIFTIIACQFVSVIHSFTGTHGACGLSRPVILHFVPSNASCTASGNVQPHQSIMSLDHLLACFPQSQSPSIIPSIAVCTSFSTVVF